MTSVFPCLNIIGYLSSELYELREQSSELFYGLFLRLYELELRSEIWAELYGMNFKLYDLSLAKDLSSKLYDLSSKVYLSGTIIMKQRQLRSQL